MIHTAKTSDVVINKKDPYPWISTEKEKQQRERARVD